MTDIQPTPLQTPRPAGDPVEIKFVREQAEFWSVMPDDHKMFYMLIPACYFCSSGNLWKNHRNCTQVCVDCGKEESTLSRPRAGRIARR